MGDIALEIPLPLLANTGLAQRDRAALARIEWSRHRLDRPALAGGVAPFEQDHYPRVGSGHPACHRHQLFLERLVELLEVLALELLHDRRIPLSLDHAPARDGPQWGVAAPVAQ
jgi:hypothetical protein